MNRKGFELAISTLILIILGILILIGLAYALTEGFSMFKKQTDPFLGSEATSIKEACKLACTGEDKITYCCRQFKLGKENITCMDNRLEINCGMECREHNCSN